MSKIAVLGAGLCGLVVARDLRRRGHEVLVLEAGPEVGGVIRSEKRDGYLLETGPNTLALRPDSPALELLEETGLLEKAVDANPEADKRFVARGGKLIEVPTSPKGIFRSKLLSFWGKLRLLIEPLLARGKNANETVAAFVKRRLGQEVLDYAVDPFVAGVFAANPETLISRHAFPRLVEIEKKHRSLLLGFKRLAKERRQNGTPKTRLVSFPEGLGALPRRLAAGMEGAIRTNAPVQKVCREASGWRVEWTENGEPREGHFDSVTCSLPAHKLTSVKWESFRSPEDFQVLAHVPHHPVSVLYHGFRREDVGHPLDGFGFLVPRKENLSILGTLFSSTLFPERAPEGHVLLTTFLGGERQPELAEDNDDTHLMALGNLRALLDLKGDPVFRHRVHWPRAIPLPDHGQDARLAIARRVATSHPGLHLTGSHLTGVSLPDCIAGARKESAEHG